MAARDDDRAVVVVATDVVRRLGLTECIERLRPDAQLLVCPHCEFAPSKVPPGAVVLIDPLTSGGLDRLAGAGAMSVGASVPGTTVVAVSRAALHPLATLRLAEAGAEFLVTLPDVVASEDEACRLLLEPAEDARLGTRWAIRESLDLAWDGDIETFLREARSSPEGLWLQDRSPSDHGVGRREVLRLRRLAHEVGGLPPPDFRRYSTSVRSAPELPEWAAVKRFARVLFGWGIPGDVARPRTHAR